MKPFDLKRALAGDPVVTRDGRKIEFVAHDPKAGAGFRILARREGESCASSFYTDGKHTDGIELPYDLFMAPTKREAWVNVHSGTVVNGPFLSESIARSFALPNFIACCRIEWEE